MAALIRPLDVREWPHRLIRSGVQRQRRPQTVDPSSSHRTPKTIRETFLVRLAVVSRSSFQVPEVSYSDYTNRLSIVRRVFSPDQRKEHPSPPGTKQASFNRLWILPCERPYRCSMSAGIAAVIFDRRENMKHRRKHSAASRNIVRIFQQLPVPTSN
jgi:hypothetical protein